MAPVLLRARLFSFFQGPYSHTRTPIGTEKCTPGRRIPDHFAGCPNFEQSLPKMVTKRKRWSTSAGSGWPQGRSLVVQVSGGALARTSSVNPSIKIKSNFRGNRVDTIFRAGLLALLFFLEQGYSPCSFLF